MNKDKMIFTTNSLRYGGTNVLRFNTLKRIFKKLKFLK